MEKKEITCAFCGGKGELKFEDFPLLNGKIILKEEPHYECKKCGEKFVTGEQMRETEKRLNTFSMKRPVISTGRSLAITFPSDLIEYYSIKKGTSVQIIPESRNIIKLVLS